MGIVISSSHIISATPFSSLLFPAPMWSPSHGTHSFTDFSSVHLSHRLQFSTNCFRMSPFHGMQSRVMECELIQTKSSVGQHLLTLKLFPARTPH